MERVPEVYMTEEKLVSDFVRMTNYWIYELWTTRTCNYWYRISIFKVICFADGNEAVKDFVVLEKIKAQSSSLKRFKIKNCNVFWVVCMIFNAKNTTLIVRTLYLEKLVLIEMPCVLKYLHAISRKLFKNFDLAIIPVSQVITLLSKHVVTVIHMSRKSISNHYQNENTYTNKNLSLLLQVHRSKTNLLKKKYLQQYNG